jgi:tellurite resistance protein
MIDFFPEIEITQAAAEAIARGLYAVAKCDGLHEREEALVASFWGEVGGTAGALGELARGPAVTAAELTAALPTPELRRLFLKTAILLAWADGKVSDSERKVLAEFSGGLGIATAEFLQVEAAVKEYLLAHLAPISNTPAVVDIAKKMGV